MGVRGLARVSRITHAAIRTGDAAPTLDGLSQQILDLSVHAPELLLRPLLHLAPQARVDPQQKRLSLFR
jgi:hypothetical protein